MYIKASASKGLRPPELSGPPLGAFVL